MARMGLAALELGPTDRCLLILPLFHVNGILVSVLMPLLAGASVVIGDRFDPATFFECRGGAATYVSAVPTILTCSLRCPTRCDRHPSAGRNMRAAPPRRDARASRTVRLPIIEGYGSRGHWPHPQTHRRAARTGTWGSRFRDRSPHLGVSGESCRWAPTAKSSCEARSHRGYLGRPERRVTIRGRLAAHRRATDADGYRPGRRSKA